MQVTNLPPLPANALVGVTPDAATRVLPQIQSQAAQPMIQRAVDPANKPDRGNKSRSNGDRAKGGGDKPGRGNSVNIRV